MTRTPQRSHLIVNFCDTAWGETVHALTIARDLVASGDACVVLTNNRDLLRLPNHSGLTIEAADLSLGLERCIDAAVSHTPAGSLILADFATFDNALRRTREDPAFVRRYGLPTIVVDTWDSTESGATQDFFGDQPVRIGDWAAGLGARLLPAPPVRPHPRPGVYAALLAPVARGAEPRRLGRALYGLPADVPVVLFCTSGWQHVSFEGTRGHALATALPHVLAGYLAQIEPAVHLVHLGPAPYPLGPVLGERYRWVPPQAPERFSALLSCVDAVLSANVWTSTISRCVGSGVPVLIAQNSCRAETVDEAVAWFGERPPRETLDRIERLLPLYPFGLWPFGWSAFLAPLMRDNSYLRAVERVEILQERAFIETCTRVLFDRARREASARQQAAYADQVSRLPRAADVIRSAIERCGEAPAEPRA